VSSAFPLPAHPLVLGYCQIITSGCRSWTGTQIRYSRGRSALPNDSSVTTFEVSAVAIGTAFRQQTLSSDNAYTLGPFVLKPTDTFKLPALLKRRAGVS